MLGVLVQLLISWGILYMYNRKGLSVLGLIPNWRQLNLTMFFLVFAFLCAASAYVVRNYVGKEIWNWNPELTVQVSTWAYYLAVWNPMVLYLVGGFLLIRLRRNNGF